MLSSSDVAYICSHRILSYVYPHLIMRMRMGFNIFYTCGKYRILSQIYSRDLSFFDVCETV